MCYFTLRSIKSVWEEGRLESWTRIPLGLAAWGALLGAGGIVAGIAEPVFGMLHNPDMSQGFLIGVLALGATGTLSYANSNPELFDFDSMKSFPQRVPFVRPLLKARMTLKDLAHHVRGFFNAGDLSAEVLS